MVAEDEELRERLVRRIELAFEKSKPGPLTLQQADRAQSVSEAELEKLYKQPATRRWQELADAEVESCGKAFYGADIESWLSFLPAWLRWTVKNFPHTDSFVVDKTIYTLDPEQHKGRFAYLSLEQSTIVYEFLELMAQNDVLVDADAAQRYIDQYWKTFAPPV